MAAKRNATTELNHDNWDKEDDDEPEEPGIFQAANEATLKQRTIKRAKRRVPNDGASGNSTFSGFGGFGNKNSSNASANFSFLSNIVNSVSTPPSKNNNPTTPAPGFSFTSNIANSVSTPSAKTTNATKPAANFSFLSNAAKPANNMLTPPSNNNTNSSIGIPAIKPTTNPNTNKEESQNPEYLAQLRNLNEGVLAWIKSHVDKNPYCILTPVFKDYGNHLSQLEDKFSSVTVSSEPSTKQITFGNSEPAKSVGSLMQGTPKDSSGISVDTKSTFSFGGSSQKTTVTNGVQNSSLFSFGASAAAVQPSPTSIIKPFSFAVGTIQPPKTAETNANEEEPYEPPKNDYIPVTEDESLYSTKCKLFYLNGGAYVDKGVGTLYLKECEGKPPQLLVRADTNLGNILLNISLSAKLPMQRTGKNYVQVVCVPFPPLDAKKDTQEAVTFLVRVKTGEDADQLLAKLNKHKK